MRAALPSTFFASPIRTCEKREIEIGSLRQYALGSLGLGVEPQRLSRLRFLQPTLCLQPILFGKSITAAAGFPKDIGKPRNFIVQQNGTLFAC
jgi:hypothetical protein